MIKFLLKKDNFFNTETLAPCAKWKITFCLKISHILHDKCSLEKKIQKESSFDQGRHFAKQKYHPTAGGDFQLFLCRQKQDLALVLKPSFQTQCADLLINQHLKFEKCHAKSLSKGMINVQDLALVLKPSFQTQCADLLLNQHLKFEKGHEKSLPKGLKNVFFFFFQFSV